MFDVKRQELLFSIKMFTAAMLAFYLCSRFSLPQPSWSILTVFMVLQPLAAAAGRSKAAFRFLGSAAGAAIGVIFSALFSDSPYILLVLLGLTSSLGVYLNMIDGTARGYAFLLAGLTPIIVAIPSMGNPNAIAEGAIHRPLEVGLGIACALFIDAIFFPQQVTPSILGRLDVWSKDVEAWLLYLLRGSGREFDLSMQQKLAAEAGAVDQVFSLVAFDPTVQKNMVDRFEAIQRRMLSSIPRLYTLSNLLRDRSENSPELETILHTIADTVESRDLSSNAPLKSAIDRITAYESSLRDSKGELKLREIIIAEELRALLEDLESVLLRRLYVEAHNDNIPADLRKIPERIKRSERPKDHYMAFLTGLAGFISYGIACFIWAETGSVVGSALVLMAVVGGSFFGMMDNPAAAGIGLVKLLPFVIAFDAVFMYGIYPAVHDFEILVLAFAIPLIPLGIKLAKSPAGLMPLAMVCSFLGFQSSYAPQDFGIFLESGIAMIIGITLGSVVNLLFRSVTADVMARRIMRAAWLDISEQALKPKTLDSSSFTIVMLRRLGLILPRLAALSPEEAAATNILSDVQVGLSLASLRREKSQSADESGIDALLSELRLYYSNRKNIETSVPSQVFVDIKALVESQTQGERKAKILSALYELDLNLKINQLQTIPLGGAL